MWLFRRKKSPASGEKSTDLSTLNAIRRNTLMSSAAKKVDKKVATFLLEVAQKVATLKNQF